MSNNIAAKLIIENILNLEQARKLLENEISNKIFTVVDQLIKDSVEGFNDEMIGDYNFTEEDAWFLSKDWQQEPFQLDEVKTHKYLYAYYALVNEGDNDETNEWWLSNFFSNSTDQMVFNFLLHDVGFNKVTRKMWKVFYQEMNQEYPQLEQAGFKFNTDGSWYLPIKSFDQKVVAENYVSDTLEDALTPITEALEIIKKAHPIFKKIVQEAIDRFGRYVDEEEVVDTLDTKMNDASAVTPLTAE